QHGLADRVRVVGEHEELLELGDGVFRVTPEAVEDDALQRVRVGVVGELVRDLAHTCERGVEQRATRLRVLHWLGQERARPASVRTNAARSANATLPPTVSPRVSFDPAGAGSGVRSVSASSDRIAAAARAV